MKSGIGIVMHQPHNKFNFHMLLALVNSIDLQAITRSDSKNLQFALLQVQTEFKKPRDSLNLT